MLRATIETPSTWLAVAVPTGAGAAFAAGVALLAQLGRASIVNGRLEMLGAEPAWWSVARVISGVLLVLGVVTGIAAGSRTVRDSVDRRAPSVRRAWRETLGSAALVIVVTVIASLGVGAIAIGARTALALAPGLVIVGLVIVGILVVLGVALLAPLTLALSIDALEGGGLAALPRTFEVARQYSRLTSGRARVRTAVTLLFGLAAAGLAIAAPWGGSLLLVALVTFGTTLVVATWAVLAAGVWTGVAADGLEALGRAPVEGAPPRAPGAARRILLAVGALALAPMLTAVTLAVPSGIPAVESAETRVPKSAPAIAAYGDGGVAVLSMLGVSTGFDGQLSLCRAGTCRLLDVPDFYTTAMSSTPEGDLVFARWRRTPDLPEVVLTRLTPAELDTLIDHVDGGRDVDPGIDSRRIGYDDGPGVTVVLAEYDIPFPEEYEPNIRGQDTTLISVDATGATPVVASLEAFPKDEEGQTQEDSTPILSVYRCDDAACSSSSTIGATGLDRRPSFTGSVPTFIDVAADENHAAVALASYPADVDPIRLFTFVDGAEPAVSSLADPLNDRVELSGEDTAGVSVALRPDGLATVLWRMPTQLSLGLTSCLDERCAEWATVEIAPGLGERRTGPAPALAVDASGMPLIAVATPESTLVLLDCLDAHCEDTKRTELIDLISTRAPVALGLDHDRPILIADGADRSSTFPDGLPSQVVRCLEARCG